MIKWQKIETWTLKSEWQLVPVHLLQVNASVLQFLQYPFKNYFTETSLSMDHKVIWSERYCPTVMHMSVLNRVPSYTPEWSKLKKALINLEWSIMWMDSLLTMQKMIIN